MLLNRHGRIQNILATHGYENTDWFFNMVLCVFMIKTMAICARTKVRELHKLGTSLHAAISATISRKGLWYLARTLTTQIGMTNQWLKDQRLLSVKELWVNIHYPSTARQAL